MTGFTLDTAGEVAVPEGRVGGVEIMRRTKWSDLSPFAQGYVQAGLASLFIDRKRCPVAQRVYEIYAEGGEQHSDLDPHYRCGRLGVRRPEKSHDNALAVWEAGFNSALRFSDLAPATLAEMLKDCEAQVERLEMVNGEKLSGAPADWWRGAAEVFWRERQSGVLTGRGFPPIHLTLHDEGLIYIEARAISRDAGQ